MAASLHTESAINPEEFTPSKVPMLAFGFGLGAIMGFVAWYIMLRGFSREIVGTPESMIRDEIC
ncbi:hypothetical protein ABEW05_001289 [Botrytis cinerea]